MKLFEFEGKSLFHKAGIPIPQGGVADSADQAREVAAQAGYPVVLKSQVLKGGRGKAGGIRFAENEAELTEQAKSLFELEIGGEPVERLLIEKKAAGVAKELYAGITLDARTMTPLLMVSTQGGVDIEEVAEKNPEAIAKMHLDPEMTYRLFHLMDLLAGVGLSGKEAVAVSKILLGLIAAYFRFDAFTAEINPILVTEAGEVIAADSKVEIDDGAVKRIPELKDFSRGVVFEDPLEAEADEAGVSYVGLGGGGNIGIICSGAGLAMATMDIISALGGRPANFLDLGGGAPPEKVAAALRIVLKTEGVEGVLFNVFGGSNNCEKMAKGIAQVVDEADPDQTIIVKMRGYSQEEGWALLEERNIPINKYGNTEEAVRMMLDKMEARGIK